MVMEAVPNVSEGRRADVLAALMAAGAGEDAHLLNVSSDPSHNRTVLTLAGTPAGLHEAMLALVAAAIARIDLAEHQGVHPRLGAVDVMPFVPLSGSTMADAVALAKRFAGAAADTFGIPVYLYEEAAPAAHRQRLDQIRAGGLAGLAETLVRPKRILIVDVPIRMDSGEATQYRARLVALREPGLRQCRLCGRAPD